MINAPNLNRFHDKVAIVTDGSSGIGLATVLRIVKAHEGFLRVDSTPGEGTAFEIFLPRAVDAAAAIEKKTTAPVRGNGETILIADDDSSVRLVLSQAFTRLGYQVRATGNATTLLKWVSDGEGDLVVTDVVMPDENVFDVLPRIRKERPKLPIIVMSAQNNLVTAVNAAEVGAFDYVPKPFDLDDMTSAAKRALLLRQVQIDEHFRPRTWLAFDFAAAANFLRPLAHVTQPIGAGVLGRTIETLPVIFDSDMQFTVSGQFNAFLPLETNPFAANALLFGRSGVYESSNQGDVITDLRAVGDLPGFAGFARKPRRRCRAIKPCARVGAGTWDGNEGGPGTATSPA